MKSDKVVKGVFKDVRTIVIIRESSYSVCRSGGRFSFFYRGQVKENQLGGRKYIMPLELLTVK